MAAIRRADVDWGRFRATGLLLVGKPYIYGVEIDPRTTAEEIKALDCSELVEWLFAQFGIHVPDGSYNQAKACNRLPDGSELLVGDLGFKWIPDTQSIHHVGIYLGNGSGRVLEAKGKDYGVVLTSTTRYMASSHFAYWGRLKCLET